MTKDKQVQLEQMCLDIFVHAECDYQVDLSGNGTNACEATNVAWAILDILHGDGRKWQDKHVAEITRRANKLKADNGE